MASFPLKTHIFHTSVIQPQIQKYFPCTIWLKFCLLGLRHRANYLREKFFFATYRLDTIHPLPTDRQTDRR